MTPRIEHRRLPRLSMLALLVTAVGGTGNLILNPPRHRTSPPTDLPDTVRVEDPGLYPEGVEYDAAHGRFLLGSVTRGTVTAVQDDGSYRTLVSDTAGPTTMGLQVAGDRLYVARSDVAAAFDSTVAGRARLGVYDLATGRLVRGVELGSLWPTGRHFANDVAVDADGNVYITDSLSPVVYRVAPDGSASVFAQDSVLGGGFALNGIEVDPGGWLLVAVDTRRALYRIPLAHPDRLSQVAMDEPLRVDGMVRRPNGNVVAVAATYPPEGDPIYELVEVASADGWRSASVVARAPLDRSAGPTTVALRAGAAYVVQSHIQGLSGKEPVRTFEIVKVPLEGS